METLIRFQSEIESLAAQLEKLLKVINHSDPSAETMKVVLYEKYKQKMSLLAGEIKSSMSWSVFYQYLVTLQQNSDLAVSEESKEVVVNKLIKDFENAFITRHELSEFSPPDPVDFKQQQRIRSIRKQIRTNRKNQSSQFNANDLSEMITFKHQQKTAKKSLDKLVKAFSKIDLPEVKN